MNLVIHIYPSRLQLNKANVSDTGASFLDLYLSISDGFVKVVFIFLDLFVLLECPVMSMT